MNTDHRQYPRCRHHLHLRLRMGCGGKAEVGAEVVKVVYQTKNYHSASTQSSYTWLSSAAPRVVSVASTAPYPFRGTHTAPCTSYRPPPAAFAMIYSMHGFDHECPPHQSQQAQLQTYSLENMTCCKRSPSHRFAFCSGRRQYGPIPRRH